MPDTAIVHLSKSDRNLANLVYVLYLVSLAVGITSVIGVIMAYVYRADAPGWLQTHYTYMIHTFWKGLLFFVISAILCIILIGYVLLLVTAIWWIVRCIKGMMALSKNAPISPATHWGL